MQAEFLNPLVVAAALLPTMAPPAAWAQKGGQDPLPSWNDGPAKKAIVEFVGKVTRSGSPAFVPPAERLAVFDNDGTLWCEPPRQGARRSHVEGLDDRRHEGRLEARVSL